MSDSAKELKLERECLRLASDLMQLARDTLNPDLQAHCIRMAKYWTDRADGSLKTDLTGSGDLDGPHDRPGISSGGRFYRRG